MATLEIDAIRQVQAQFDQALSRVGLRAPAPIANQSPIEYLQDACQDVKRKVLPRGIVIASCNMMNSNVMLSKSLGFSPLRIRPA